ncbi:hypothetical protein [Sediminispirochaeta smaragdinae]|uniref:Transporter n=1 Tax=Sediminispirochaeta smaragdinae (strain DSM 11293 / JCM 15392 / SEBR 4228) TaxID=573413 RepID=E1R7W1_SEDSS|nr:hypothetical protein [Sediminispirochaeta smaragdinae]ADK82816.1 hypothetical protein Spirs_3730 [Sediminispirochaeta smaragdinae DSM 11293]
MKKFLVVMITLTMFAPMLMADKAKMLPKGVLRLYFVPSYSFGDQEFDSDGDKVDGDEQSYFNLGIAAEYGITDFISAAFQWTPGYTFVGNNDTLDDSNDDGEYTGAYELFAGAKVQVIGQAAPVYSEKFRVAFAGGIIIPMAFGYDAEDEVSNFMTGKSYQVLPSHNAYGLGARFYGDYVVNDDFYLNLYSEYKYYFPVDTDKSFSAALNSAYSVMLGGDEIDEIDYGYDLTLEVEPHYDVTVAEGIELGAMLPVTYVMTPETELDGEGQDDDSKLLRVAPGVNVFVTRSLVPLEFSFNYRIPLWGEQASALQAAVFQVKAYMKF